MPIAVGYLLLGLGAVLARQVAVGRAMETPGDIRDLAVALLSADTGSMQEVFSRRGENVSVEDSGEVASVESSTETPGSTELSRKVVSLGQNSRGYALGAEGPTYYDCSGLVWRAAKSLGIYNGPRFTTSNFKSIAKGWAHKVGTPKPGDIVLWPTHHMGVYVGNNKMYSARSPSKGVGYSSISGDSGYFGSQPEYWRVG